MAAQYPPPRAARPAPRRRSVYRTAISTPPPDPGPAPEHEIVTAPQLAPPTGYAHAVIAAPGRHVYLGGQTAEDAEGRIRGATIVEQFDRAAANVVIALRAAGGEPRDIVSLQIFVTDPADYRAHLGELGSVWRAHFGRRYPASGLFGVTRLYDPAALVELVAIAVVPDRR